MHRDVHVPAELAAAQVLPEDKAGLLGSQPARGAPEGHSAWLCGQSGGAAVRSGNSAARHLSEKTEALI